MVESSVIPIADVMFEHRLYLPSAGAFMAAATGIVMAGGRLRQRWRYAFEAVLAVVLAAILALQTATFLRNRVWQSEVGLWEDWLAKNPFHAKAQAIIGLKYLQRGGVDEAIRRFRRAIELKPGYAEAHVSLGNAYLTKGWLDEGYREYQTALAIGDLDHHDMAQLTMNIGTYYLRKRQPDKAIQSYRMALGMMPGAARASPRPRSPRGSAARGQDPPPRRLQRHRTTARRGAAHRRHRIGSERIQQRQPLR